MPRVSRTRVIPVDQGRVWELISDPHNLPRWWPRTKRVEDVRGPTGARAHWTAVLETERGTGVRADYRCTSATANKRYEWEQQIEGTPFARVLRAARLEIGLSPADDGTAVTLTSEESLRGLSKLGATMMRGAARSRLDEALAGIERVLVG
jgi:uncharacterized protein YndB with AHSA1/START domain